MIDREGLGCIHDASKTSGSVYLISNAPNHGAAGVDIDFKTNWPPPLPWKRWSCSIPRGTTHYFWLGFFTRRHVSLNTPLGSI